MPRATRNKLRIKYLKGIFLSLKRFDLKLSWPSVCTLWREKTLQNEPQEYNFPKIFEYLFLLLTIYRHHFSFLTAVNTVCPTAFKVVLLIPFMLSLIVCQCW